MDIDEPGWDLYRSFLAVAGEGSLSAAARMLGMTQPSLVGMCGNWKRRLAWPCSPVRSRDWR